MNIAAYAYKAEVYCPACIRSAIIGNLSVASAPNVEESLNRFARILGVDRENEYSFDSDDFPKVVFSIQIENAEYCADCGVEL